MGLFKSLFTRRPFRIRPSKIDEFLSQIMNLVKADPPVGERGKYYFGAVFSEGYNPYELFYLRNSLIRFVFDEEKVSEDIVLKFDNLSKKYLQQLYMRLNPQQEHFPAEIFYTNLEERIIEYSDSIAKILKTKSFSNKMGITIDLYKYAYKNLFHFKFEGLRDVEIEEWLSLNVNNLDIIRTFILWFYEVIIIVMSPYDTFYFEE